MILSKQWDPSYSSYSWGEPAAALTVARMAWPNRASTSVLDLGHTGPQAPPLRLADHLPAAIVTGHTPEPTDMTSCHLPVHGRTDVTGARYSSDHWSLPG
jgi:hypothetical protein